jgi:RimJ/RimL family protein N-acetyltransferase
VSVRSAAEAAVAGAGGPLPWAVDLSGGRRWLAVDVPGSLPDAAADLADDEEGQLVARVRSRPRVLVGFRELTRADLPAVVAWQSQPHVARWWHGEATSVDAAESHYGPALDGADPTRLRVVEANGRSVGMVQDYLIADHPEYALLTARPDAVGIDYLLGEPAWVGAGLGTRVLWCYLRDVLVPHYPSLAEVFAAPDHRNAVSLRVLDKLGFERGLWFDEPQDDGRVDTVVGCTLDVRRLLG